MSAGLRIGSIFSGIGGLELGLERAGVGHTVWQCECDPYALRVLAKHWPTAQRFDDVRHVDACAPAVDLICAGFPCQDISYAGLNAGLTGERSGLFFELMRCVRALRPKLLVLENVAALLGRGMGDVLAALASCGYDAEWDCIPAQAVGSPQLRDRIFIIGVLADHACGGQQDKARAVDARAQVPPSDRVRSGGGGVAGGWPALGQSSWPVGGAWVPEPSVGRVAHGVPNRLDRLRCLGNAVVPQVAMAVGQRVLAVARCLGVVQ